MLRFKKEYLIKCAYFMLNDMKKEIPCERLEMLHDLIEIAYRKYKKTPNVKKQKYRKIKPFK